MSRRGTLVQTDGTPTARGQQIIDTGGMPTATVAAITGLSPQVIRTYRSQMRRHGFAITPGGAGQRGGEVLHVHVAQPVADELREQGRLRFVKSRAESAGTMLGMVAAIIHKDGLYNAVLGDPPAQPPGRSALPATPAPAPDEAQTNPDTEAAP